MASPKLFFSLLVLTSLLSIFASCSSSEEQGIKVKPPPKHRKLKGPSTKAEKVELALYYETLCPDSASFIVQELRKVFDTDLIDIVNLRLIPYGNAHIQPLNDTIVCQHGPDECYLNSIEACAISRWPDVKKHFTFIQCVENKTIEREHSKEDSWKSCCQELGMNQKPVRDCYNSGLQRKLILQYANETNNLSPPHQYVPWVLVNKQPLREDYKNYVSYVCKAYKGSQKPEVCRSPPPKINSAGNANSIREGCYSLPGEERQDPVKVHN